MMTHHTATSLAMHQKKIGRRTFISNFDWILIFTIFIWQHVNKLANPDSFIPCQISWLHSKINSELYTQWTCTISSTFIVKPHFLNCVWYINVLCMFVCMALSLPLCYMCVSIFLNVFFLPFLS